MDLVLLREAAKTVGITVTDEQVAQLLAFRETLYELNKSFNLTRVPYEECEERHFIDSILPADLIQSGSKVLDVGTGPGFPAWPLACLRPDLQVAGLDGSSKPLLLPEKHPLPNLRFAQGRAEQIELGRADVVIGRAVAPLPIQLEISCRHLRSGGLLIPYRGESDRELIGKLETEVLGLKLQKVVERALPSGAVRLFPIYSSTGRPAKGFPRTWAEIKKRPLAPRD